MPKFIKGAVNGHLVTGGHTFKNGVLTVKLQTGRCAAG